jgi:hypothetical protein
VSLTDRSLRREVVLLAGLSALVVALNVAPITNNDLFLHLRTGREVLSSFSVPEQDDYSALARGRPFIAHEWLAGVLFRLIEVTFGELGLDALIVMKVLVALLVAGFLYAAARTLGASPAFAIPPLAFVLILASARFLERPHIFTYLMTSVYLWLLARRGAGGRAALWCFVPLQILWANLHGGFLLGPVVVALAALGAVIEGLARGLAPGARRTGADERARPHLREGLRLGGLALVLLAACLINPYGARLLAFPFQLTGSTFMQEIYEWLPPFKSAFAHTYMARLYVVWAALGIGVLVAAWIRAVRKGVIPPGGIFPALLFGIFFALSLKMNRNVTDFALATYPGVAATAAWIAGRDGRRSLPVAPIFWMLPILLLLAVWFGTQGYDYGPTSHRAVGFGLGRDIPVKGADYLEANGIKGNIFNTYKSGAYLLYRFYPDVRVAMDSRNDVYGEELYESYKLALGDQVALERLLDRIEAAAIFLEWPRPNMTILADMIHRLGGWRPVYFDDTIVVYLREGGAFSHLVARDGHLIFDPVVFFPGGIPAGRSQEALAEADRAIERGGGYVARIMRLDALAALGRYRDFVEEEARILSERPPLAHIYIYLGVLHLRSGDRRAAADRFLRALDLQPASEAALRGLREATTQP